MKHLVLALFAACAASSNPPARPAPAPDSSGSKTSLECSTGDQAAVYCVHVKDACCSREGWTCNNARYVEWFREYCRK